jgi:heterodisulfide reductase subunit D
MDTSRGAKLDEGERQEAEGRRKFPYARYFSDVNLAPQILLGDIPWLTKIPPKPERRETLLYLGCQALKTPHFCLEAMDVLTALGMDFVAFGGSAVCCGSVHQHFGRDLDLSERVGNATTSKIGGFQADNVLTICPNCTYQYEHGAASKAEVPFEMRHFYDFLHERIGSLQLKPLRKKIGLHRHAGSSHHQDEHGQKAFEILSAIPGVTIVDLPAFEELGVLCYPRGFRKPDDKRHAEIMDALFGAAMREKVDVVATIYHACQRELCQEERRGGFEVKSVVGLVAEALGYSHEDTLKRLKKAGDVDAAMAELAPNIAAHRIDPAVARALLESLLRS